MINQSINSSHENYFSYMYDLFKCCLNKSVHLDSSRLITLLVLYYVLSLPRHQSGEYPDRAWPVEHSPSQSRSRHRNPASSRKANAWKRASTLSHISCCLLMFLPLPARLPQPLHGVLVPGYSPLGAQS